MSIVFFEQGNGSRRRKSENHKVPDAPLLLLSADFDVFGEDHDTHHCPRAAP
jgi:hypothetical protein